MDSSLVEDYKEEDEELEGSYDSDDILSSLPKEYKSVQGGEMKYFQVLHMTLGRKVGHQKRQKKVTFFFPIYISANQVYLQEIRFFNHQM